MKGPFTVYHGNTPLTVPISDESRLALAYNMLYSIAEDNCAFETESGTEQFKTIMDTEKLVCRNKEGKTFIPEPDPEWVLYEYGSEKTEMLVHLHELKHLQDEEEKKTGERPLRELAFRMLDRRAISFYSDSDDLYPFYPTWSHEKAREMYQFMCCGICPSVSFYADGMMLNTDHASMSGMYISSEDGDMERPEPEPDWAENKMDEGLKNRIYHFSDEEMNMDILELNRYFITEPEKSKDSTKYEPVKHTFTEVASSDLKTDMENAPVKTNADTIREMSNEELTNFLCSISKYANNSRMVIGNSPVMHSVTDVENYLNAPAAEPELPVLNEDLVREKEAASDGYGFV